MTRTDRRRTLALIWLLALLAGACSLARADEQSCELARQECDDAHLEALFRWVASAEHLSQADAHRAQCVDPDWLASGDARRAAGLPLAGGANERLALGDGMQDFGDSAAGQGNYTDAESSYNDALVEFNAAIAGHEQAIVEFMSATMDYFNGWPDPAGGVPLWPWWLLALPLIPLIAYPLWRRRAAP